MKARQPLAENCVMPCSSIAAGTVRVASSTPIRIMPPAMPRMPEMNEVTRVARPRVAMMGIVMVSHSPDLGPVEWTISPRFRPNPVHAMKKIAIVVFDDAQVLDVAGPMEMFRGATLAVRERRAQTSPAYETHVVAHEAGPVRTSCGLTILATDSFAKGPRDVDTLIVAGGVMDAALGDEALLEYVRATAGAARRVVATGTGTFVLATAGLLDGHRATTHWRACKSLADLFPKVEVVSDQVFVRDGPFLTSAGASAALDQSLAL